MVVGIDFSKSNEWTGEKSYQRGLHDGKCGETPYGKALRIVSTTVCRLKRTTSIPCTALDAFMLRTSLFFL